MTTVKRVVFATLMAVLFSCVWFAWNPSNAIYRIASIIGIPNELSSMPSLPPHLEVHDDYFVVERLDPLTIAISEPRYWQRNVSYLILGSQQAVLLDSGPGVRDILPLVKKLTALPVTVMASHLHYDHISALGRLGDAALVDLAYLRRQVNADGYFHLDQEQYLGAFEKRASNGFKVQKWLTPGSSIELGGRSLTILTTPGHTDDSMMLYDHLRHQLFSGDFIYPGYLVAILPGAHMGKYTATVEHLLTILPKDTLIFAGHGAVETDAWELPQLGYQDLLDLRLTLVGMRAGSVSSQALFPQQFRVNDRIAILAPFPWNQNWTVQ